MELAIIIVILHFFFDWFQPRWMQNSKHGSVKILALHTFIATLPLYPLALIVAGGYTAAFVYASMLIYCSHYVTDYCSSNIVFSLKHPLTDDDVLDMAVVKDNEYLIIITTALDQMVHLVTYFLIFNYLL